MNSYSSPQMNSLIIISQKWKAEQQKIEAMSAASAQTFSYMNKQQPTISGYRYAIDDRYRWAQVSEAANFYAVCISLLKKSSRSLGSLRQVQGILHILLL